MVICYAMLLRGFCTLVHSSIDAIFKRQAVKLRFIVLKKDLAFEARKSMNKNCNQADFISEKVRFQVGIAALIPCCLSLLGCLFVIAILIIYKKYAFSTQRLIPYLSISVFTYTFNYLIQISLIVNNETEGIACEVVASITLYSSLSIIMSFVFYGVELLIGIMIYKESGCILNQLYFLAVFINPSVDGRL